MADSKREARNLKVGATTDGRSRERRDRPHPYASLADRVLSDLASGRCVSIVGLSNSGKSTLMRALAGPQARADYKARRRREGALLYVDCNHAVDLSGQAFYEVVLRAALQSLGDRVPADLGTALRKYHEAVTEAENAFAASLSFNLALTEMCEDLGADLVLLLDEFDEIYAALDERALLNLRALRDRYPDRLFYLTATVRALPMLRGHDVEGEFAELFARSTNSMPLLKADEAEALLEGVVGLDEERRKLCVGLSGGHAGLLIAVAQVLADLPEEWEHDPAGYVGKEPGPRAECLKIWSQLTEEEQESLIALALEPEGGLPRRQLEALSGLGLVRGGSLFSPIFAHFVGRRGRAPEVKVQGVHVDADSGDVWVDGVRIPVLTDLEFRLLETLYGRLDKLTDKYQIVTTVWGEEYLGEVDDARVEKLISRLRSKIEPDPSAPRYLITRRGRGYQLLSRPRSETSEAD